MQASDVRWCKEAAVRKQRWLPCRKDGIFQARCLGVLWLINLDVFSSLRSGRYVAIDSGLRVFVIC